MRTEVGTIYLVGAGPGDPGLITVRGLMLLRRANVVVYDRLVARELLQEARDGAELVYAGKSRGDETLSQAEIGALLVERARRGLCVVRLKGGDPYLFGRGFEEFSACRTAGVPCVVVSGVTSAIAAPSAAGIPITSRKQVRSVAIITGTTASESESSALDYAALAKIDTVIVLMGRENLSEIAASLVAGGRHASTPAAAIQSGTTRTQRVVRGTLGTIARLVDESELTPPVVTVVGEVAAFASDESMAEWNVDVLRELGRGRLEQAMVEQVAPSPLRGRRIVVTRARSQSAALTRRLERQGAIVIPCPLLRITFPPLSDGDRAKLLVLDSFDRVVFTSANGVRGFFRALRSVDRDVRSLGQGRIVAVGTATARALRRRGLIVDVVARRQNSAGLADTLRKHGRGSVENSTTQGASATLVVGGNVGRSGIHAALDGCGGRVESVTVYRNEPCVPTANAIAQLEQGVDAVLFYSPSAVTRFAALGLDAGEAVIGCIGSTTADAARAAGFQVGVIAVEPSDSAMRDALAAYFDSDRQRPAKL